MRISDWSADVCFSDLDREAGVEQANRDRAGDPGERPPQHGRGGPDSADDGQQHPEDDQTGQGGNRGDDDRTDPARSNSAEEVREAEEEGTGDPDGDR